MGVEGQARAVCTTPTQPLLPQPTATLLMVDDILEVKPLKHT